MTSTAGVHLSSSRRSLLDGEITCLIVYFNCYTSMSICSSRVSLITHPRFNILIPTTRTTISVRKNRPGDDQKVSRSKLRSRF